MWTVDAVFMCDLAVTINGATHQIQSVLSLTPDQSCSFRTAQLMLVRDHAAMPPSSRVIIIIIISRMLQSL